MAITVYNTVNGWTNVTGVLAANTGGASGTQFSAVTVGTTGAVTWTTTNAIQGSTLVYNLASGATADQNILKWTSGTLTDTPQQAWFRFYIRFSALPAATLVAMAFFASDDVTTIGSLVITTTGTIKMWNTSSVANTTSTTALAANTWYRLEGFILSSATVGQTELKIYKTIQSNRPDETNTSPATEAQSGSAIQSVHYGGLVNTTSYTIQVAGLGWSDVGYMGPLVLPPYNNRQQAARLASII
jgi:hypothetical protein